MSKESESCSNDACAYGTYGVCAAATGSAGASGVVLINGGFGFGLSTAGLVTSMACGFGGALASALAVMGWYRVARGCRNDSGERLNHASPSYQSISDTSDRSAVNTPPAYMTMRHPQSR